MGMTKARCAALILTAGMLVAGCSDGGGDSADLFGGAPVLPTPTINAEICTDPDRTPVAWGMVCGGSGPEPTKAAVPGPVRPFGEPATTAGDTSYGTREAGKLELTPTTTAYIPSGFWVAQKGEFVCVTVQQRNTSAVPSQAADGTTGAGWDYLAPDGEAFGVGYGSCASGFNGRGPVQPGTFQWASQQWDIRPDQRGGIIQYTDGAGKVYRWQLPAVDTGPQVAEVKKGF